VDDEDVTNCQQEKTCRDDEEGTQCRSEKTCAPRGHEHPKHGAGGFTPEGVEQLRQQLDDRIGT
jgi:hypothetical protein